MQYALIKSGKVENVIEADAAFAKTLTGWDAVIDVTGTQVGINWTYNGTFAAPVVPKE